MIRRSEKSDDFNKVANLIYNTDQLAFSFLFGKKKHEAISNIAKMVSQKGNFLSFENCYVFVLDDTIVGLALVITNESREFSFELFFSLGLLGGLIFFFKILIFGFITTPRKSNTLYLQNLSVDSNYRGQGIGTELLKFVSKLAKEKGYQKVSLDVSLDNPKAKKLYVGLGYKKLHTKTIPFTKIGVDFMQKKAGI